MPGDQAGLAPSDRGTARPRPPPSRPGQADGAFRAAARDPLAPCCAAASTAADLAAPSPSPPTSSHPPDPRRGDRSAWRRRSDDRGVACHHQRVLATLRSARLACLNVQKLGLITLDPTLDDEGNNGSRPPGRPAALGGSAPSRRSRLDLPRARSHRRSFRHPGIRRANRSTTLSSARARTPCCDVARQRLAKVALEARCTVTVVRTPRAASLSSNHAEK